MNAVLSVVAAGVVSGLVTVFVVPAYAELGVWTVLIGCLAWIAGRPPSAARFGRAFVLGIVAGVAVTVTHLVFLGRYLEGRQIELEAMREFSPFESEWQVVLVFAPLYWLVLGALTGGVVVLWRLQRGGASAT